MNGTVFLDVIPCSPLAVYISSVACCAYSLTVKIEALCFPEMLMYF